MYRAKGRTEEKLRRKEQGLVWSAESRQERYGRGRKAEGWRKASEVVSQFGANGKSRKNSTRRRVVGSDIQSRELIQSLRKSEGE
jgi:hypothetical protein